MKRTLFVALVLLLSGTLTVEAGAVRVGKTYEGTYKVPGPGGCGYGAGHNACAYAWDCRYSNSGCALVKLERPTTMARMEIADDTGLPVFARVYARGGYEPVVKLCGRAGEPLTVDLKGATELIVHIVNGTCEDSTPSTPTTGVVRVTRL